MKLLICDDEKPALEMMKALQQYVPFVMFKVHPVATVGEVNEMLKALSG